MKSSKVLVMCAALLAVAGTAVAGPVGDSIFFQSAGANNPGLWSLGLNNNTPGAYLPVIPFSGGYTFFNDSALTPNPNKPLVGDINGDGVADAVNVGSNGSQNLFLGRNTGITGNAGDLLAAPIGNPGWPDNFIGHDITASDFFLADVNGDGHQDVVTRKPTPWDGGTTSFWEASNSTSTGIAASGPQTWAAGIGTYANTAAVGDFNGDGSADIAEYDSTGLFVGMTSTPGVGLNAANPTFWGSVGRLSSAVATLIGDINGDGLDDVVEIDNRNGNGNWTWVAGLTGSAATPAGIGINTAGLSWASPFSLDANSISAIPLLADLNNDGCDDLVLYEEYLDTASGNIWSRMLASYTVGGNLMASTFNEAVWYDWVGLTGLPYQNMVPMVGNVHIPEPASLILLGLGAVAILRRRA